MFDRASRTNQSLLADAVVKEILRAEPVVFPAMADRVGLLGFPVAGYVLNFYANLKQIEHAGRMAANPAGYVPPADLRALVKLIEEACRQNALPLLSKLPRDKAAPDTERKAKIEAMGQPGGAANGGPWTAFRRFRARAAGGSDLGVLGPSTGPPPASGEGQKRGGPLRDRPSIKAPPPRRFLRQAGRDTCCRRVAPLHSNVAKLTMPF
jgi:hypothetical protein